MSEFMTGDEIELRPLTFEEEEDCQGEADEEKFVTLERGAESVRARLFTDLCQALRTQFPDMTEAHLEEIAVGQLKLRELAEQNINLLPNEDN